VRVVKPNTGYRFNMEIEDTAFIDFDCPYCKSAVSYLDTYRGTVQACPNCQGEIVVPRQEGEPGRPLPMPMRTPRLILRRLAPTDWKDLLEYYAEESLFQFDFREPLQEEQILHWLEGDPQRSLTKPGTGLTVGIVVRQTEKLIGDAGIRLSDAEHSQAHLSLCINRHFHRQGFATETMAAMLVFCFREIGLRRVTAACDSRNTAALGLLAKAGLRREGEFVKDQQVKGQWINTAWFAMLGEEYTQRTNQARISA
jgi:ribosomal-protein-alanine N-acetyltransferase